MARRSLKQYGSEQDRPLSDGTPRRCANVRKVSYLCIRKYCKVMSLLGNIIWFILGGFLLGMWYIIVGLLFCITIVGIPFGYQLMKLGVMAMFPFGQTPEFENGSMGCVSILFNVLWILLGGIELALAHAALALLFFVTIIGIPFGMQHLKLAKLALVPFGQCVR